MLDYSRSASLENPIIGAQLSFPLRKTETSKPLLWLNPDNVSLTFCHPALESFFFMQAPVVRASSTCRNTAHASGLECFSSQIVKVLNTKRQMRNGVEQAAENRKKGLCMYIYIGLAFAMHEMQHPVPTLWRTSVGPDGEKGWVSAWGCRHRLHLHSSAQLFMEKHPGNAQPLTQLCSPSQEQHFFMAPKTGGILQAWEMKGAGSSIQVPNGTLWESSPVM